MTFLTYKDDQTPTIKEIKAQIALGSFQLFRVEISMPIDYTYFVVAKDLTNAERILHGWDKHISESDYIKNL